MHKRMLRGLIFDLDGTLADSLSLTWDAFNHGFRSVGSIDRTPKEIMAHFGTGEGEIFAKMIGRDRAAEAYDACRAYTETHVGRVPLHEGVPELLHRLRQAEVPLAIVTGRSWDTTEIILDHHGMKDWFMTVVAHDHVASSKPSPEGIHLALSRMKLNPEDILYVGDSHFDIRAAHNAGAGSVAALWDLLSTRDNLAPHLPHYWAEKPSDVWNLWSEHRVQR